MSQRLSSTVEFKGLLMILTRTVINVIFDALKMYCCSRYSLSTSLLLLLFVNIWLVFITLNRGATSSSTTIYSTDGASDTFVDYQIL